MSNYEGRRNDLNNRINKHLSKLTGIERDYLSKLTQIELVDLKSAVADINNLLTFQMTIASANWICEFFNLNETARIEIMRKIDNTKPNTKGFDIHIISPYKIIAEVKCIVPVNNGGVFGAAQHDAILNDVHKLINGKGIVPDTSTYFKFLFLIDLGDKTSQAIQQLVKETKGTTPTANRFNELKKTKISQLTGDMLPNEINTNKVYIKKLELNIHLGE